MRPNPYPCPPLPEAFPDEYRAYMFAYPSSRDEEDDDSIFDDVYDFITSHELCPMEHDEDYPDDPEIDTECAREWTYELMEAVGRKYGTNAERIRKRMEEDNPQRGGWLRGLATAGLAALGLGGIVAGEKLRRR